MYINVLRLLLIICMACAAAGIALALAIADLARPGYVPAIFLTVILLGLALGWEKWGWK